MEALTRLADKVENIELITKHLGEIDAKLVSQGERLDRVQAKMDLSMTSLGQVQLEQTQVARALKAAVPSAPVASPTPAHQLPPLLSTPAGASAASTSTAPPPPLGRRRYLVLLYIRMCARVGILCHGASGRQKWISLVLMARMFVFG